MVAPNSPSARAQHEDRARLQRRPDQRQRHAAEDRPARGAERARRVLEAAIDRAQRAFHGEDEERHRDERLGEHRAGGRERQADAEPCVEPAAPTSPRRPKATQQRDAADDRRQHDRQHRERAQQPRPGKRRRAPAPTRAAARARSRAPSPRASRPATGGARVSDLGAGELLPDRRQRRRARADRRAAATKSAAATPPSTTRRRRRSRAAASRRARCQAAQESVVSPGSSVPRIGEHEGDERPRRRRGSAPRCSAAIG